MENRDIRLLMFDSEITAYDIAGELGCSPQNIYQRLKKPLSDKMRQKILDGIRSYSIKNGINKEKKNDIEIF